MICLIQKLDVKVCVTSPTSTMVCGDVLSGGVLLNPQPSSSQSYNNYNAHNKTLIYKRTFSCKNTLTQQQMLQLFQHSKPKSNPFLQQNSQPHSSKNKTFNFNVESPPSSSTLCRSNMDIGSIFSSILFNPTHSYFHHFF